jgi:hypothetical protein
MVLLNVQPIVVALPLAEIVFRRPVECSETFAFVCLFRTGSIDGNRSIYANPCGRRLRNDD